MKNKIIFLDIDGVLNGYGFWSYFGWKLACLTHNENIKEWYRKIYDPCGVHEHKVKLLSKIVKTTNAKIVMSSSWRNAFWKTPYERKKGNLKKLSDLFDKYNIIVIDITPHTYMGRRDEEIKSYISKHENEISDFIILDDERFDLECFADTKLIQTSTVKSGEIIKGYWHENTGLKRKHVKKAIKLLNGG